MPKIPPIRIQGDKELLRVLEGMDSKVARPAMRRGISKAMTPIMRTARALVPVKSGLLRSSLIRRTRSYKKAIVGVMGPRASATTTAKGKRRGTAPHAHLVHEGTRPHEITIPFGVSLPVDPARNIWIRGPYTFHHPGARPNRFLTNAFQQQEKAATRALNYELITAIERAWRA